ncbi:MAG: Gldg family protein, partial [Rhodovarius sp.]|nr:Gldg family protein [Rhodovarius sp.]
MSDTTTPRPAGGGRRGLQAAAAILVAALVAIGANMLADRFLAGARLDLTREGLYTLSPGTRSILAGLQDPITLRFFYSRRLGA